MPHRDEALLRGARRSSAVTDLTPTGRPPCRRCLLAESGEAELAQSVAEYIAALPEDARTPEQDYRARLDICRECEDLLSGVCRHCGCFAEARAAKAALHCPAHKW